MVKNDVLRDFKDSLKRKSFNTVVLNTVDDFTLHLVLKTFAETKENIILVTNNLYKARKFYDKLINILDFEKVSFFPADEIITAEVLAVSNEFKTTRINTIIDILENKKKIIVTHTLGYFKKELTKENWLNNTFHLKVGEIIDKELFVEKLLSIGYHRNYQVEQIGEFSVRGYMVDIYPIKSDRPVRVEFFDNEIDEIRVFDIDSQLTVSKIDQIMIYPMNEFFYDNQEKEMLLKLINSQEKTERLVSEYNNINEYNNVDQMHRYIDFLDYCTISDLVSNNIVFLDNYKRITETYVEAKDNINNWYENNKKEFGNLKFDFFENLEKIIHTKENKKIYIEKFYQNNITADNLFKYEVTNVIDYDGNYNYLLRDFKKNKETFYLDNNKGIVAFLEDNGLDYYQIGNFEETKANEINLINNQELSFRFIDYATYISSDNILKKAKKRKNHFKLLESKKIKNLNEIKEGDYVVHYDYGIGKYLGVKIVELEGIKNDYIHIGYKKDEVLYVPVENINLIQKYSGSEGGRPKINSIGGSSWAKTKAKVRKKIKDIADKLIKLYAERNRVKGFKFKPDNEEQAQFEADFIYTPTEDQIKAIQDIKADMETITPMDRLICGDVGYGKTEVAIRAVFKAVSNLKQVSYLCPTTILSKQHYQTFKARFTKYGIRVEVLNRFVPPKTQKAIIRDLKKGLVDILIGTHRILSSDIEFQDLGLLIIDEEQRFGVEHKEKIKELKTNIDVLTLTATPIPRTLQMALMGIKSTSLLETPPLNRYPIQTYVLAENKTIIKEAIEREIARDGQVFYLHNRVADIKEIVRKIKKLVPEANIRVAHGQMTREELEDTMSNFIDNFFNVLICTTIIETGIDIPNANTLIIDESHRLGLSQLYQIRGRVGRSDKIAYAYLMYPKNNILTQKAESRLEVIKEFTELGSGYKIAMKDLSIRGAGDVLGAEQSGFIDSVGIDLFMEMLNEEVQFLQGEKVEEKKEIVVTSVKVQKHIPDEYVEDQTIKIEIHKKIKSIKTRKDVRKLTSEFKDKYGKIPNNLKIFMEKSLFDTLATKYQIEEIVDKSKTFSFRFSPVVSSLIDGEKLLYEAYKISKDIDLSYKNRRITIKYPKNENCHYLESINKLLGKLKI